MHLIHTTSIAANPRLQRHDLNQSACVYTTLLPDSLMISTEQFDRVWDMHPAQHQLIWMVKQFVPIPRWQAAFGANYRFSGQEMVAESVPEMLSPWLSWVRDEVDPRLNGILVNWYQGPRHYIGKHNDSTAGMCDQAPIVTISFGETRVF